MNFKTSLFFSLVIIFSFIGFGTAHSLDPKSNEEVCCTHNHSHSSCQSNYPILAQRTATKKTVPSKKTSTPKGNTGNKSTQKKTTPKYYHRVWREDIGMGYFAEYEQFTNGIISKTCYSHCLNCHGTTTCSGCSGLRMCKLCFGQGYIITAGYGNYIPCYGCNSTGLCPICKGSGKCVCSTFKYPGYGPYSSTILDPNGKIINHSSYTSGSSRSSSRRDRSSKNTCSDCGGTGLWKRGKTPEYAQPASQFVAHYNREGFKCPYCGYYDSHWHSKCITCMH